jgi:hypothetical protein
MHVPNQTKEFPMPNYSKLQFKTKGQVKKYFLKLADGLDDHLKRTIVEIGFGMTASGSTLLSEISRCLQEIIPIKKTVERLRKNLYSNNISSVLEENHLKTCSSLVTENSVIVVDDSDLAKPHSKAQEGLNDVYDGSTGQIVKGFNLLTSGLVNGATVLPLSIRLFSSKQKGFQSATVERQNMISKLSGIFDSRAVYVMDRGFSGAKMLKYLGKKTLFVCRSIDRKVNANGEETLLMQWANKMRLPYYCAIERWKDGKLIIRNCAFSVRTIQFAGMELEAVVMKLEGHDACVLVTNQQREGMSEHEFGQRIIGQYGKRWRVEEVHRCMKQQYDLENVRVRNLVQLNNMMAIAALVSAFPVLFQWFRGKTRRMAQQVYDVARGIRTEVNFWGYRIAEGLKRLLRSEHGRPFHFPHFRSKRGVDLQMYFEEVS